MSEYLHAGGGLAARYSVVAERRVPSSKNIHRSLLFGGVEQFLVRCHLKCLLKDRPSLAVITIRESLDFDLLRSDI